MCSRQKTQAEAVGVEDAIGNLNRGEEARVEARLMFEQMLGYANHLGLYAAPGTRLQKGGPVREMFFSERNEQPVVQFQSCR